MDPITFIKNNITSIEKNCKQNWIVKDQDSLLDSFTSIIQKLELNKRDRETTKEVLIEWLRTTDPYNTGFFRKWLLTALENDYTFVFATNYLIQCHNRDNALTMELKDTLLWDLFLDLSTIKDVSLLGETIMQEFPDTEHRRRFLILFYSEIIKGEDDKLSARLDLVKSLLNESNKILEEAKKDGLIKNENAKKSSRTSYKNFADLFKNPDQEDKAKRVKEILREMGLIEGNKLGKEYFNKQGEPIKVNANSLAYVFAALKDSENGLIAIVHGSNTPQLKRFYKEFGLFVAEKGGDVTRKALTQTISSRTRTEHPVYRQFTALYRK